MSHFQSSLDVFPMRISFVQALQSTADVKPDGVVALSFLLISE
jgi:hypothetical protein